MRTFGFCGPNVCTTVFHGQQIFKYDDLIVTWTNGKERRGLLA